MKISENNHPSITGIRTPTCKHCRRKDKIIASLTRGSTGKPPKQRYFDEKWLAIRLGTTDKTIQKMRYAGSGPKWTKFGRSVRYRLRDVVAYESKLEKGSD